MHPTGRGPRTPVEFQFIELLRWLSLVKPPPWFFGQRQESKRPYKINQCEEEE
jgi:hypothetical protein